MEWGGGSYTSGRVSEELLLYLWDRRIDPTSVIFTYPIGMVELRLEAANPDSN